MTESDARRILYKLNIDLDHMRLAQKNNKYPRNSARIPQQFFAAIQFDFDAPAENTESSFFSRKGKEYKLRTGLEQSQLLLKAGFDAVRDSGRNQNYGIINAREPDQMLFLRRDAFEILEVFNLNQKNNTILNQPRENSDRDPRKLAALVFEALNDKLVDQHKTHFYSVQGKALDIDFIIPQRAMQNRGFGEKKHKEDKLYSSVNIHLNLFSDREPIHYVASNEKFKEICDTMKFRYDRSPKVDNFVPYTKERFLKQEKDANDERIRQIIEKRDKENKEWYDEYMPKIVEAMKILGIDFSPRPNINYPEILDQADKTKREAGRKSQDFWPYYDQRYRDMLKLAVDMSKEGDGKRSDYRDLIDNYYMSRKLTDAKQLRKLYDELSNSKDFPDFWTYAINKLLEDKTLNKE